jgi:DNA-binding transcriptional LysR family regulator
MELYFNLMYNQIMKIDLNEVVVFIKVVEMGSFSQAARQLGMPNSTVSSKMSDLEKRLGISLIRRTTRKLFVTQEGQMFFERCTRGLDEIRQAEDELLSKQSEPQGLLKITSPIELGSIILPKVIEKFRNQFPKINIDVYLSDRTVDIVSEGFDLAIRVGELKDSSLIAKKLGGIYFAPFASSSYLKKNGTPKVPKDLKDHSCLQFSPLGTEEWSLCGPRSVTVSMKKQIVINELNSIKALTISGVGISLLPTFLCYSEVQAGKLVRVLPEWRTNIRPVHFVYAGQKHASPKVNAFISVATEIVKSSLQSFEI